MQKYIIKRDGSKELYNRRKIENAMSKAFISKDGKVDEYAEQKIKAIADFIEDKIFSSSEEFTVEHIQDLVQNGLMNTKRKDVAEEYIIYRNDRTRERNRKSRLMIEAGKKLKASDVQNQNANVDEHSFGGRMGEARDVLTKEYALEFIIPEKMKKDHNKNRIYLHDLNSYAVGEHNCFSRDTKFLTNFGIRSFSDFKDGDRIKVLAIDGIWRDATVRFYGRQKMQRVTFARCGMFKEVDCTANHRWILEDGTVCTDLSIGDRLYPLQNSTNYSIKNQRDAEMFALGFIIGDGCDKYTDNNSYLTTRLCGEKVRYASIFEQALYHSYKDKNGNDLHFSKNATIGKQQFLTNMMWNILSLEDKISLFNGYYAADGSQTTNTKSVYTSDERVLRMIMDIAPLAGYHIFNIKEIRNSTNYKENRLLFEISFTVSYSNNSTWEVIDIVNKREADYEAWCIEEPITHSFTLLDGVVTGNCLSIPYDHLLLHGFNTRQTDVRGARSVNTALQLVAVIMQLQSLQQFGGVSATHIDWTLVYYVRLSFMKHYMVEYLKSTGEFYELDILNMSAEEIDDWVDTHKKEYLERLNLKEEDFRFDNKENLNKRFYQAALYETRKETYQAVEAMYHNLNFWAA